MNKSLTVEDYDLILDNKHFVVPAVLKEKLLHTPGAMERSQYGHLTLPASSVQITTNQVYVYDKDKDNRDATAIVVTREGCVRYWHAFNKNQHTDTRLDVRHEFVLNVHLLHLGSPETDAIFSLVTTAGSIFLMNVSPDGKCTAVQACIPEGHGIVGRMSSFFFGSGPGLLNHVNSSLVYTKEYDDNFYFEASLNNLNNDTLLITIGTTMICAYEIAGRRTAWHVCIKSQLAEPLGKYLAINESADLEDLQLIGVDGQLFKEGLLVLIAATHPSTENVNFFIVYVDWLEDDAPLIKYFREIKSPDTQKYFNSLKEGTYLSQVKLCVPEETKKSSQQLKTEGVFFLHQNFIHSIFLPDSMSQKEDLVFIKTRSLRPKESAIGYGKDSSHVYLMCADSKTATPCIFPSGFEATPMDDVNILDVVAGLTRPTGNPEAEAIYSLFVDFCDKQLGNATARDIPALEDLSPQEDFEIIMSYLWNVMDELSFTTDYEQDFKEKRKFLDYFILFLKHSERFGSIFSTFGQHGQTGQRVQGAEFFHEMYERLQIFYSMARFKYGDMNMADLLKHVAQNMTEEFGINDDSSYAALKFSTIHLIPQATVNLCKDLLAQPVFKDTADRLEMLTKSTDLIYEFAESLKVFRSSERAQIPVGRAGPRWTLRFLDAFCGMCLTIIDQFNLNEIYNKLEFKKLLRYIQVLLPFHFEENPEKPDGHPILYRLYELRLYEAALELAHTYKDFNIICRIMLERGDDDILETYKSHYETDNFEEYYLSYLYRKNLLKELLAQKSEKATKFISSIATLRWRRDIQMEKFDDAARTLLSLVDNQQNTLFKRQGYLSFAKMAMLSAEGDFTQELKKVAFYQDLLSYQESLPDDFIKV